MGEIDEEGGETEAWRIVHEVTVPSSSFKPGRVGPISILQVVMSTCPRSQEESPWNVLKNKDKNKNIT